MFAKVFREGVQIVTQVLEELLLLSRLLDLEGENYTLIPQP